MSDLRLPLGKTCTKCGEWKLYEEFHKNKRTKDGFVPRCKLCKAEYASQWYQQNKERQRELNRRWIAANTERWRQYRQSWYFENKEHMREVNQRWRDKNVEQWRSFGKRWRDDNLQKARELERLKAHKRRALKRQSSGSFTREGWEALCLRYGGKCLCCGSSEALTIDHVVPLSKGGTNDIQNIQPLCNSCNIRKGVKSIDYR